MIIYVHESFNAAHIRTTKQQKYLHNNKMYGRKEGRKTRRRNDRRELEGEGENKKNLSRNDGRVEGWKGG
jgi:hypothetical protein